MQSGICRYFVVVLLLLASQLLLRVAALPQWDDEESGYHTDTCSQPSEYGDCHSHDRMFYYSRVLRKCLAFDYSSCGGNENRFPTIEDCLEYCRPQSKPFPKPDAKKVGGRT